MASNENSSHNILGVLAGIGILLLGISAVAASGAFLLQQWRYPIIRPVAASTNNLAPTHDFELVQLGEMRRDQFLLDKTTGHVWTAVCDGNANGADCSGNMVWTPMSIQGIPEIGAKTYTYEQMFDSPGASK
ncbi:MAG TPA: hypothetical protein VFQ95_04840 [Rhodanobacteraceae bacterium]|nr:hypothetical protein [Rhodanobacteraceae bacterium]